MTFRSIIISLIVVASTITVAGCRNEKAGLAAEQSSFNHHDSSVYAVKVTDMTCHNCVAKIKGALAGMKEVQGVDCDTITHDVFVKLSKRGMPVEDDVLALIRMAGFKVNASPNAQ